MSFRSPFALALVVAGMLCQPAAAQPPAPSRAPAPGPAQLHAVRDLDRPPPGHRLTARQVMQIAGRVPAVAAELRRSPGWRTAALINGRAQWVVRHIWPPAGVEDHRFYLAETLIDDRSGRVVESWTGWRVAWSMARGYPGMIGATANAWWIWLPLCVLFVVPFARWRRPLSMVNLDLLALTGLSLSVAFFNHGEIETSVPLVYPPLLYLLGRLLWIGLGRSRPTRPAPLQLNVRARWLGVAIVALLVLRIGLCVVDSQVIDVGYAGVVGADKLAHGQPLYGHFPSDIDNGDTYGPVVYAAYVPFELAMPWDHRPLGDVAFHDYPNGTWPAARAAALFFDLLCVLLLWLLGRRIRGPDLGAALAFAWLAYPFTLLTLNSGVNDSLIAALLVGTLLVASRPAARGAMLALAALAKVAPLALVPLLAAAEPRRPLRFAAGLTATAAVALAPLLLTGDDPVTMAKRTLLFQAGRDTPFSIWSVPGGLGHGPQVIWQVLAMALAVGVAFIKHRRDVIGLGALAGAIVIALQISTSYWFYTYVVWFFPLALLALLADTGAAETRGAHRSLARPPVPAPPPAVREQERQPVPAPSS